MQNKKTKTHFLVSKKFGKYLDFWSIPHFLFGSVTALFAEAYEHPFVLWFSITFVLAILWERFERFVGIRETKENARLDIILPLLAFLGTMSIVHHPSFGVEHAKAALLVSLLIYLFTNFLAWQARFDGDKEFRG